MTMLTANGLTLKGRAEGRYQNRRIQVVPRKKDRGKVKAKRQRPLYVAVGSSAME